jgi:hypothetical protein
MIGGNITVDSEVPIYGDFVNLKTGQPSLLEVLMG